MCKHYLPATPRQWTLEMNPSGNLYCVFCGAEFLPKPEEKCVCSKDYRPNWDGPESCEQCKPTQKPSEWIRQRAKKLDSLPPQTDDDFEGTSWQALMEYLDSKH